MHPNLLKQALSTGFGFLTRLQVNSLVSDPKIPTNAEGDVAWREFLPKLTALVKGMSDPKAIHERSELAARAEFQPAALMDGKDQEAFFEMLKGLFAEVRLRLRLEAES